MACPVRLTLVTAHPNITRSRAADGRLGHDLSQVFVRIVATDTITSAGIASILGEEPGIAVTTRNAGVLVVATAGTSSAEVSWLRTLREPDRAIVLLTGKVTETALLALISCGVVAILDRYSVDDHDLVDAVLGAARNRGLMPSELLGTLLGAVRKMQQDIQDQVELIGASITEREVEVLRLLAGGAEIAQIAQRLSCSESTIKNVLHALTTRLKFRNRVQAVAFAARAGLL